MTVQTLTLNIPGELYQQIREQAKRRQHSIEEESVELLAAALPTGEALPRELLAAEDDLAFLDDDALWRAAHSHLAQEMSAELESLHFKQGRQELTAVERESMVALTQQYERAMLIRSRAAALLHERGHDVSTLLAQR